mmetsp:Transcript_15839/g.29016  ORF Transcript_15839/g.29016 Transcript_15839/m.29016 type:complete len:296 (-) Transcript_15839:668-1555(-)
MELEHNPPEDLLKTHPVYSDQGDLDKSNSTNKSNQTANEGKAGKKIQSKGSPEPATTSPLNSQDDSNSKNGSQIAEPLSMSKGKFGEERKEALWTSRESVDARRDSKIEEESPEGEENEQGPQEYGTSRHSHEDEKYQIVVEDTDKKQQESKSESPGLKKRVPKKLFKSKSEESSLRAGLQLISSGGQLEAATRTLDFSIHYRANFGESIILVGSHPSVGDWNPDNGISLQWTEGDIWKGTVSFDILPMFEYKYLCGGPSEWRWEGGSNHSLSEQAVEVMPATSLVTIEDTWKAS